jgi:hypothetical protein
MADVNANIGIHIDSSAALAELKTLQRQLATFHASIAKNSAASAAAQKGLQQNLLNSINATGQFHAQMGLVRTSTESFTHALENNKLSMREYFRYAGASSKSFGKLFKSEFDTIGKVAEERVRKMQTQYIKMGRDASGALKAMSVTPATLNMKDYANQTAVAAQKQALFNQLVKQGSTSLLNFGKNTQWAGRQLMVGFSVPLMYIGTIASKTFMEMEEQAIRFKRVYGDIFTTSGETEKAIKEIELLAKSFTKYGVALTDTMKMAADAAAMGKTGAELTAQISEATRLAVLGGVEQEQALETTISLTNAFGVSADKLASKINFLNAVENQTVVSIEDLTIAIPKAGPVIQQLGGDVEDLAFFLTAMKEGGINASEGANALKSGLAALINPSKKASAMLGELGININGIVESNAGDVKATVVGFAQALDTLDPLNRARAIEQLFGKFQFARLSTLFQNITKDGSQANKVLGLTQASVEELAILSQRELKKVEDAVGVNFKQSVEDLKIAIMPIGKAFLEALTPIVKFAADILKRFDGLSDGTKKFIVVATTLVGILGPTLLMTFGLVANGAANIIKLFLALRSGFLKLGGNATVLSQQTSYLNAEQLEAATVAASLNQAHTRLTQSFTLEATAVNALRNAYVQATTAALTFARANPGMMMPGFKGSAPKKFKKGTTGLPGPKGAGDIIPILAAPGEAIIPANVAQNPAYQPIIDAMVNGKIQGFEKGTTAVVAYGAHQPFTTAHESIAVQGKEIALADGTDFIQYTSSGTQAKKGVVSLENRVKQIEESTGKPPVVAKDPFALMEDLQNKGITKAKILLGSDRMERDVFDKAAEKYGIALEKVEVPRTNNVSATRLREAVAAGDIETAESLLAKGTSEATKKSIIEDIKNNYKPIKVKTDIELAKVGALEDTVTFNGKTYQATSKVTAKSLAASINEHMETARLGGYDTDAARRIQNRMDDLSTVSATREVVKPLTLSRVFKHYKDGIVTSGGVKRNNPAVAPARKKLEKDANRKEAAQETTREKKPLIEELKKIGYSDREAKRFVIQNESHILNPKDPALKNVQGQVVLDHQGLNTYLNRAGGVEIGKLLSKVTSDPDLAAKLGYSEKDIRRLAYDYTFAQTKTHPASQSDFERITRLADLEDRAVKSGIKGLANANVKRNVHQARGVVALSKVRTPNFYRNFHKKVLELGERSATPVKRGKVESLDLRKTFEKIKLFTEADMDVKSSIFKDEPVTVYQKRDGQSSESTGYSFRAANHLSGKFTRPDKTEVFVKPMMDLRSALAEQRGTKIAREAHGLEAPEQTLRVIQDPKTGKKLFALESPFESKFDPKTMPKTFTEKDYFSQLVAANLRGDKDLKGGNLGGNILTDVGTAGVFAKASGKRDFAKEMPSMEQMAEENLKGIPKTSKASPQNSPNWFANATADIPKNMTSDAYDKAMKAEIAQVKSALTTTLATLPLNEAERPVYQNMLDRLDQGAKVDWRRLHQKHTSIVIKPDEMIEDIETTKQTKPKTTSKPADIKSSSKNVKDSKIAPALKKNQRVVQGSKGPKMKVVRPGFADAPISQKQALANLQGMAPPRTGGVELMPPIDQSNFKRQSDALNQNIIETNKTTNRIKELGNKGNVAIGALSGLTIAGTFAGGKIGEMANAAMPFVFAAQGVSGIMSMMPDSMTKMKGGMLAATAVIGTFITVTTLLNKTYNDAQNKAMELSEATGASAKAIENFAVFSNKASAGQIVDERNKQKRTGFAVQQGKTSFGEAYVAAPDNQALIQGVADNIKTDPKKAMQDLTQQLSTAVASGVFTPEQARSVAINIGQKLGNVNIGLQASAQLTALYGEDGSNILKDPLSIRVNLMEEATKGIAGDATKLGSAGSAVKGGSLSAMNQNVAVGGTVAAAAGAGALIGSVAGPIGTVTGAAIGAIAAGAGLMFTMKETAAELGRLSGISVQNQQNALNVNKEMSAAVEIYYENLIKVKNAEGDIEGAKKEQKKLDDARVMLAEKNAKTVKAIADSYKNTSGQSQKALVDAAKKATGKKYKGTDEETFVSSAQSALANQMNIANNGKKGQMEYVLTMQMNAGNIKPSDMMALIQTFGKSEKSMDKVMTIISKFGGAKAAETQQILGAFVDKNGNPNTKVQTEFLTSVSAAKTTAEADKILNFYGAIAQNQGILDVGVMVNYFQNNPEAAERLQGLLDKLKENEGKLTYDVVTNFLPPTGDEAIDKEYFEGLNQDQRIVYTQQVATIVSMSEAEIKKSKDFQAWIDNPEDPPLGGASYKGKNLPFASLQAKYADSIGQKVTNNKIELAINTPPATGTTLGAGTKPRNTTLDELLKKLKFVRDAAIDAEGNINSLVKVVSGKGITKFAGVSQQLLTGLGGGGKGGFNREFISMLESMDNKTRAIYMTEKKGIVTLTAKGKALKEAFNEKVIGEYQNTQVQTIQDTIAQQAAFVKLKAAGIDTATALDLTADASLAVAINSSTVDAKKMKELAKQTKEAKNETLLLARAFEELFTASSKDLKKATEDLRVLRGAKETLGYSTEDIKIIAENPAILGMVKKILDGDGTGQDIVKLQGRVSKALSNIKAKVKIDADKTQIQLTAKEIAQQLTDELQKSADSLQSIFDHIADNIRRAIESITRSVSKPFDTLIKTAQSAIDKTQSEIDDTYTVNTDTGTVTKTKSGLQTKSDEANAAVEAAQKAADDQEKIYTNTIKIIEDKYFKESLDANGNIIKSGFIADAQSRVDAASQAVKDLQNKGGINAIGLTQFGAAAAGDFKVNNLTLAEAEKAIADVEAFIEKTYSSPIEMLQRGIAEQQRTLELTYTRAIEKMQKEIEVIQKEIADKFEIPLKNMQTESSKLSEDLAVMDNAADAINKKYETQENALTKIAELNQDIVEQQKQQLGLADALSKGDISAAAAAVQDIRATQAAKSLGAQQGTLGKAKEAELAAIKSPSGMTRDQIAERQFVIERASYEIQVRRAKLEKDIADKQEAIYKIENDPARLKILKDIQDSEDKIYELDKLKLLAMDAIKVVQDQIKTRNTEIATQQAALAKAEKDLQDVQDKREAELKAAELKHQADMVKFKTAIEAAEKAAKEAADALAAANKKLAEEVAALEAIEKAKAAAIAKATEKAAGDLKTLEESIADAGTAVEDLTKNLGLATTAAGLLATALAKVQKDKDDQNEKDLKAIADKTAAEIKAAKDKAAAEKKIFDDKIAEFKAKIIAAEDKLAAAEKALAATTSSDDNIQEYTKAQAAVRRAKAELEDARKAYALSPEGMQEFRNNFVAENPAPNPPPAPDPAPLTPAQQRDEIRAKNSLTPASVLNSMYPHLAPFNKGGMVMPKYFASGGFSKGTDTIPAMLTPGEFVIKKSAVDSYGVNNLSKINNGMSPDSSVYNYSLSVNVSGNNLNADDIASTVMQKIKYIDGQRVRGQR